MAGDNVPADCRLIEAFAARVNNATLTGESLPKPRHAEAVDRGRLEGGSPRYRALARREKSCAINSVQA
jgi:magnesium-transporting ATPase (P-type)